MSSNINPFVMKLQYWNIRYCRYYFLIIKTRELLAAYFCISSFCLRQKSRAEKFLQWWNIARASPVNFFSLRGNIFAATIDPIFRVSITTMYYRLFYGAAGMDFNVKSSLVFRTVMWRTPAGIRRWIRARITGCYWVTRTRRTQCFVSAGDTTHATRGTWRSR